MRAMMGCAALGAALLLAGCVVEQGARNDATLTAAEAREALVALLAGHAEDDLRSLSPNPEWLIAYSLDGERVNIGRWECDLKGETFGATVDRSCGCLHWTTSYKGVFRRTADAEWEAQIVEESTSEHGFALPQRD